TIGRLLQQDARAFDLLAAQRAEEGRDEAIHQLEVRRQSRRGLVRVVQNLLAEALRMQCRAAAAIDKDETAIEAESLALHVGSNRHHAAAAKRVVDLLLALHDA